MKDLISVIVPAYNVEKYLRKCLESLIAQTYKNIEIILVDDGSTDKSGEIADEYAKKDSRIIVIHKRNGGPSDARNSGLDIARGEFIAFADSDDIIDEREYEVLYNLIKKYNADISFCELASISLNEFENYPEKPFEYKRKLQIIEKELSVPEALKETILNLNVGNYVPIKMFRKELFDNTRFELNVYYEDAALIYKIISKAKKIAYTNEVLYYYLKNRDDAITTTFSEKKITDSMKANLAQYEFIISNYYEIKEIASYNWVRLYTSAMEKIMINKYEELYNSEITLKNYNSFKEAYSSLSKEIMIANLEPYRLISATILNEDRLLYKEMFSELYTKLK